MNTYPTYTSQPEKQPSQGIRAYLSGLLKHWRMEARLFVAYTVLMLLGRLVLAALFYKPEPLDPPLEFTDIALWLYRGFGFDARVATAWMLPSMLLSLGHPCKKIARLLPPLRLTLGTLGGILIVGCACIQTYYFREYHSVFNHWVFGMLYDDHRAILQTILHSYPIGWLLIAALVWSAGWYAFLKHFYLKPLVKGLRVPKCSPGSKASGPTNLAYQAALVALGLVAFAGGLRGSYGRRPLQNIDVAITRSQSLNRMVLNPFYALVFACHDHFKMHNAQRLDAVWPHGDVHSALDYLFPEGPAHEHISDYLTKTVQLGCSAQEAPQHIFIFVLESQDSWPLLPDYLPLGMNPCLHELCGKGVHFPAFVSAGEGTMESLGAIVSGLPWSSVRVNFQPTARQPYPTALAPIFRRLGYQVQFFYGGYLSWQRIEEFCKDQGFDTVWGGHVMGDFENNEWGVDDKQLLNFLARTVDPKVPSVNVILTTSNHPRYTVDVEGEGCTVGKEPLPEKLTKLYDGHTPWRVLGHTWYTDRELGRCIRELCTLCPKSLFVITGDHHSRRFLHQAPGLYERKSVPLLLYSPVPLPALQKARPLQAAGSHMDIVPTVLECIAPAGFRYASFGQALSAAPGTLPPAQAYGAGVVLGPRYIAQSTQGDAVLLPWADQGLPSATELADHRKRAQAFLALSWWMSLHGNTLPPPKPPCPPAATEPSCQCTNP